MQGLIALSRGIDAFTEQVGKLVLFLVPIVILVGVWNALTGFAGQIFQVSLGSNFYIELQWYIFSLIFLLAAAYDLKHNEHVRVDVLYGRWGPRGKAWVNLLGSILILIPFCLLLIYFSYPAVANSWRFREVSGDPGGLPRYPIKTFIIISPILLIIQGISEFIKNLAFLTGHLQIEEKTHDSSAL